MLVVAFDKVRLQNKTYPTDLLDIQNNLGPIQDIQVFLPFRNQAIQPEIRRFGRQVTHQLPIENLLEFAQ